MHTNVTAPFPKYVSIPYGHTTKQIYNDFPSHSTPNQTPISLVETNQVPNIPMSPKLFVHFVYLRLF